jgi:hypothetical protein
MDLNQIYEAIEPFAQFRERTLEGESPTSIARRKILRTSGNWCLQASLVNFSTLRGYAS